jgi:hypothetical protein
MSFKVKQLAKQLADGIRRTIFKVERTAGLRADNAELLSLKAILRRRIRELEHASDPNHPPMADWTRGRERCVYRR